MASKHELHQKGLRLTPQRELVLAAVRALGHATPEEVAEKVRQTHPGINLSTVYRNLETLENVGLVLHTFRSWWCYLSRRRGVNPSTFSLFRLRRDWGCTN